MSTSSNRPSPAGATRAAWMAAGVLVLAALAAYANTWGAPFLFDDLPSIVDNPTIRHLWPIGDVLMPKQAGGITTSGRPLVNLSLALNYAWSGEHVWSYHVVNIAIHLAAGLCLMGIVRRTLAGSVCRPSALQAPALGRTGDGVCKPDALQSNASWIALAVAALWMLHPIQTESVTYIVQRAESLCALFYLLTLYAFIRAAEVAAVVPAAASRRASRRWFIVSIAACALGMASKEVMVSAPLIVLLYDRAFVGGTLRDAWRRRQGYYLALASTWLLLAALVLSTGNRGGTAGFVTEVSPWSYALTQTRAIFHYLGVTLWPCPLIFDYGRAVATHLADVFVPALGIVALLAAAFWALVRRPRLGFVAVGFFAVLAPSSSFVPVATQTAAEHRMYLASAAVIALLVTALWRTMGRRGLICAVAMSAALALATFARNRDYRSEIAIWSDAVAKLPGNARAHNNLGRGLYRAGKIPEAMAKYERALQLDPKYPEFHYNMGVALAGLGRHEEAVSRYETALRLLPGYPEAHNNLANALVALGRVDAALPHYEQALALKPEFAEAHSNFGNALLQVNRPREAIAQFNRALALKPDYPEARYNLGNALAAEGDMPAALEQFRAALQLKPDYPEANVNAGNALLALSRPQEAIAYYEKAIAAAPRLVDAHFNLGSVLLQLDRWREAIAPLETAVRLKPDYANAHRALGFALAKSGRPAEAVPHYELYVRAVPADADARAELAQLRSGRSL